jgi:transposase-like protein
MSAPRRNYDAAFRGEAVRLVISTDRSVKQVAEEILVKETLALPSHRHRRVFRHGQRLGHGRPHARENHRRPNSRADGTAPLTAHTNYQTRAQGSLAA